jgi:mRNA interferase RelE/StbE
VAFRVELTPAAARQLRRLAPTELVLIRGVIRALADDPHPAGSGKLAGSRYWRLRVRIDGRPWRLVYEIRESDHLIVVTRIARRDEATYRRL